METENFVLNEYETWFEICRKDPTDVLNEFAVAEVRWDFSISQAYVVSDGDSIQTNVVSYEEYLEFIKLLDEAFDLQDKKHNIIRSK